MSHEMNQMILLHFSILRDNYLEKINYHIKLRLENIYKYAKERDNNKLIIQVWTSYLNCFIQISYLVMAYPNILNKSLAIATFIMFSSYSSKYSNSMNAIFNLKTSLVTMNLTKNRVKEFYNLVLKYANEQKSAVQELKDIDMVEINNLIVERENENLSYSNHIKVRRGEKILLTGANGAGKSTIFYTLVKCLDYKGEIWINNYRLSQISDEFICNNIAILSHTIELFDLSIIDNIYPQMEITDEMFAKAKNILNDLLIWDIIDNLPLKLNTQISNKFNFSYGQKKKILISRILLCNKKFVLFDEPFSGLDKESSNIIMNVINKYTREKTVIIISHERVKGLDEYREIEVLSAKKVEKVGY